MRETVKPFVVEKLLEALIRSRVQVGEEDVQRYYEENSDAVGGEHWRVSHIPLTTRAECDALVPTLTSATAFAKAAREHGTIPALAARNGDMGYFMRRNDVLGLGEQLFRLPLKTPVVFEDPKGCNIVWISEHIDAEVPALDVVRARLEAFFRSQEEARLLRALVEKAETAVPVQRAKDYARERRP